MMTSRASSADSLASIMGSLLVAGEMSRARTDQAPYFFATAYPNACDVNCGHGRPHSRAGPSRYADVRAYFVGVILGRIARLPHYSSCMASPCRSSAPIVSAFIVAAFIVVLAVIVVFEFHLRRENYAAR
jgi:hypothetical protein